MSAYKLFVGGDVVGVGPGRAECGAVSPGACEHNTPYDGFDLTKRLLDAQAPVDFLFHAYVPSPLVVNACSSQTSVHFRLGAVYVSSVSSGWPRL